MTDEPKTKPRFVGDQARFKAVPLEWPIEFGGETFTEIGLKRMTAAEVADFHKAIVSAEDNAALELPIYCRSNGEPLPDGLLDALDADDRDTLNEAALGFLPRRFRGVARSGSVPAVGEPTD